MDSTYLAGHNISKRTQSVAWLTQILQVSFRYQFPYKISLFNDGLGASHGPLIVHTLPASVHRKVKVKFAPEQATKSQKGSRSIALLFH